MPLVEAQIRIRVSAVTQVRSDPALHQISARMQAATRGPLRLHPAKANAGSYLSKAAWDRIANHLPWRLTNTSIHTHFVLVALPSTTLFSTSVPWTTTTLPRALTSMGPTSIVSA